MKKIFSFNTPARAFLFLFVTCIFSVPVFSQDTLHLVYHHTQIAPHDSTTAKIDAWVKKLGGKHVDIDVVAYFHKAEFRKFSQQRADELFLILNRKARALITINFIGPKKGSDSQRTTVDIIYKPTVSPEEAAAAAAKAKAESDKSKADAETAKKAEKSAKDSEKKAKEPDDKGKSKSDIAAGQTEKSDSKKPATEKKQDAGKSKGAKAEKKEPVNGNPGKRPAGKGTYATQGDVAEIKAARILVPRTDSPDIDSILTIAVKESWTVNKNVEYGTMSYNEAKALAKTDKSVLIFIVTDIYSKSLTHNRSNDYKGNGGTASQQLYYKSDNYKTVSSGASVMLEDGKGKVVLAGYFPSYTADKIVGSEALVFAVSQMNSLLVNLEKYDIKNNMTFNKPFKQNAARLKDKTLLLPDGWVSDKLDQNEIPALYEGKAKVVDFETWSRAITQKQNFAYAIVVPYPIGGDFIYLHYLMDASTGDVLYISKPKAGVKVSGVNVSAANTGFINSKNLKNYNDAFDMKSNEEDAGEAKAEEGKKEEAAESKDAEKKEAPKKEKKEKAEPVKKEKKEKSKGDK